MESYSERFVIIRPCINREKGVFVHHKFPRTAADRANHVQDIASYQPEAASIYCLRRRPSREFRQSRRLTVQVLRSFRHRTGREWSGPAESIPSHVLRAVTYERTAILSQVDAPRNTRLAQKLRRARPASCRFFGLKHFYSTTAGRARWRRQVPSCPISAVVDYCTSGALSDQ